MLSNRKFKKYPEHVEVEHPVLEPNSSLTKMLELVGTRKRVLDLGCATGYFAKLLTQRECDVVGIDLNPSSVEAARAYCTRAIVADLDTIPLSTLVDPASFDVIVCGDVLEHLRYPTRLLEDARSALRDGGALIASIPNVAHGAVRLSLLGGSFDYQELGILDDTHLRFFTAKTVDELFLCAGYRVEQIERTVLPLFAESDLVPRLDRENYADDVIATIRQDPECETLQFVVRAVPLADDLATRAIAKRFLSVNTELANARVRIERMGVQLAGEIETAARAAERSERYAAETARVETANLRYESELAEALYALEVAANDRDVARKTVEALRAEADAARRLNAGMVAEMRELLERPVVPPAAIAALEEELERSRQELDGLREDLENERARNEKLNARFVRHLDASIDRVRSETSDLATRIDLIQTGRIWRVKNLFRRMFRRGATV
jgi:2-polyprenyl-3-methyl-5-hydroxy-6-metoxy-1,4-benzoquinol methylase